MMRVVRSLALAGLVATSGVGLLLTTPGAGRALGQEPKASAKKKTAKKAPAKPAMPAEAPAGPAADGGLKFSRDIAPIFVANCARCHSPGTPQFTRSGFSLATFEALMKGGKSGAEIEAGKPDESTLVHRIKGEEGAKMPPGQVSLGEGAIGKISQWIKEGARLDAGVDAAAPMAKYAASTEDLRKAELAKLPASERDKKTEAVALERLKKADPNAKPEMTPSPHFLLFADMPKDRAANLLKTMEAQYTRVGRLAGAKGLPGPEKIGLYVFKERRGYTEFVRTVENQDVEQGDEARSKLNVESPYVIAVDPLAGAAEPAAASTSKKSTRSKKAAADDSFGGPERSLAGLLTEALTSGALAQAGKPPRWVTMGFGALFASSVERGSPYYRKLRAEAFDQWRQGWATKAVEALGDQTKPETVRAVGFAIAEWLSTAAPDAVPYFIKAMLDGGEKLDEAIAQCLQGNREQFLNGSGEFVGGNYGRGR